jgi:MraZ protein
VFHGEYESSVDEKGRVILPAKLRESIDEEREGAGFYITLGPDGCIELCPPSEWNRRVQALRQSTFAPERARRHRRTMSSQTEQGSPDRQGRLRITQKLLQQVGIEKQVSIIGNFDIIEIWDRERWERSKAESLQEFKNDAEQLFGPHSQA